MTAQDARGQPDRRDRQAPATISDNELKAAAYFAVGVASEGIVRGRNAAYLGAASCSHRAPDAKVMSPPSQSPQGFHKELTK